MEFVKNIDFFGKQFQFNIEKKNFSTVLGGFISLMLLVATGVATWYFGQDIYQRKSPLIFKGEIILPNKPQVDISKFLEQFRLAYHINIMEESVELNNVYFYPIFNISFSDGLYYKAIYPEKCRNKYSNNNYLLCLSYNGTFGTYNFNDSLNVVYDPDTDNVGRPTIFNYTEVVISIKSCNQDGQFEKDNNLTCANASQYSKLLSKTVQINLMFGENYFDPKNYDEPISRLSGKSNLLKIPYEDLIAEQGFLYYFKVVQIVTDEGFIFEDLKTSFYLEYDDKYGEWTNAVDKKFNSRKATGDKNIYTDVIIGMSRKYIYIKRIYIKVQDIAANVGGVISILTSFVQFLYTFYLENSYTVFMIGKMFNLNIHQANEVEGPKSAIEIEMPRNNRDNTNLDASELSQGMSCSKIISSDVKHNRDKPKRLFTSNLASLKDKSFYNKDIKQLLSFCQKNNIKRTVTLSDTDRCFYSFCFSEKTKNIQHESYSIYKLMAAAEEILDIKSEIFNLFSVVDQFRLMKKIFFNEHQCFILENRDKHNLSNIYLNLGSKEENAQLNVLKMQQKKMKMVEYINNQIKKGNLDEVDKVLLLYLSPSLKKELQLENN